MRKVAIISLGLVAFTAVAAAQGSPCTVVPPELFRPASHVFGDEGLPDGARISGSGETLGVLAPMASGGNRLILVRDAERVAELELPAPTVPFVHPPWFELADDGDVAVLTTRESIAVYSGNELEAVIHPKDQVARAVAHKGHLFWSTIPEEGAILSTLMNDGDMAALQGYAAGSPGSEVLDFLDTSPIPLLKVSDLDGSDHEVLLELTASDLREGHMVSHHMVKHAVRSDGMVWAVGRFTGYVQLLSAAGTVKQEFQLPEDETVEGEGSTAPTNANDPERAAPRQAPDDRPYDPSSRGTDARGDAYNHRVMVDVTPPSTRFEHIAARGDDLVLVLGTTDPPPGSLLVFEDDSQTPVCFELPERLVLKPLAFQFAVTEDALWLRKPFGYFAWEDLQALLQPNPEKPMAPRKAAPSKEDRAQEQPNL